MKIQYTGYMAIGQSVLLVLVREGKTYRSLKIRKTGTIGQHLEDEQVYLRDKPELVERLRNGELIKL